MSQERAAIVVGGGLISCASAYYLAREGWRVRLLEKDRIGSGASSGNCGFVCPSHVLPLAVPGAVTKVLGMFLQRDSPIAINWKPDFGLIRWLYAFSRRCTPAAMMQSASGRHALLTKSVDLYRQLLATHGFECEWQPRGLLLVYSSEHDYKQFASTAVLLRDEFGIVAANYPGEEVTRLEPALRSGLAGGWLFPYDAHVLPEKLLAALTKANRELGVEVLEGVNVQRLSIAANRLRGLQTSQGYMPANWMILATGAETPAFARDLRRVIPIQPVKGYSITMPKPANAPRIPMIFEQHHVALTPFEDSLRIGSTMEFAGYDRSLNRARLTLLMKSAQQHLRETPASTSTLEWCGFRPMIYDGLPCIDRAPGAENVVVAAGNGMIGLATAPATGKLAAQLLSGATPEIDPQPYSLRRFL